MAEGGLEDPSALRGMGRVRALIEAIEYFRIRRDRIHGSPSPPTMIQTGRAGAPGVIRIVHCHKDEPVSPPHPGGRDRARALPPPPQAPLPAVRVPRLRNGPTSPLRCPTTMPHCLEPHGFLKPPGITP